MSKQRAAWQRPWPEIDPLERIVQPRRAARMDAVLRDRLASVVVVCEDIYDPHNVGACLRTAEGYGLQDAHVITGKHGFRGPGSVARSAEQWLSVQRHDSTEAAVAALKAQGFALWVSDLDAQTQLQELPVDGKIALVVGNEAEGISDAMRAAADVRYVLPMHGMVQSYNLSVALAISLEHVARTRRLQLRDAGQDGDLPLERQWQLRARWLENGVRQPAKMRAAYAVANTVQDEAMLLEQAAAHGELQLATSRTRTSFAPDTSDSDDLAGDAAVTNAAVTNAAVTNAPKGGKDGE